MADKTILSYTQQILEKVSFSSELFSRELRKAFRDLSSEDFQELLVFIKRLIHEKPQLEVCLNQIA